MSNFFDLFQKDETDLKVRFKDRQDLVLEVSCDKEKGGEDSEIEDLYYFCATALNKDNKEMGSLRFQIENDYYVFFCVIDVKDEFKSQGVGTKLVEFLEYAAQQKGLDNIVGDLDTDDKTAPIFYNKRGYNILHMDAVTDVVQKNIDITKVNDNIIVEGLEKEQEITK